MMQKLKENILLAAVIAVSVAIIAAALIWNYGYLLKPEYRIGQSVSRLIENSDGVKAMFRITSSVSGNEGEETSDQLIRLMAGSIKLEGDMIYNPDQEILSVVGNASIAEQKVIPLDFYLTVDPDIQSKIKETNIREILNRLPEIDRKKESRRLQVNRLELPVYVDCYHMQMTGKELAELIGPEHKIFRSLPEEMLQRSTLDIEITVDRDCYCRGLNITINYEGTAINCELTINEIDTMGRTEKIATEGRNDLLNMTQDDWLNIIIENML